MPFIHSECMHMGCYLGHLGKVTAGLDHYVAISPHFAKQDVCHSAE